MSANPVTWLIVNARSGSNSRAAVAELERQFAQRGMEIGRKLCFPDDDLPRPDLLEAAGVSRVAVFTGDGTLNAAIAALHGWGGEVLVLPGGTMNLLSIRLHGDGTGVEEILDRILMGAARRLRPLVARCDRGDALAGLLIGPGTAWANVREAMRDLDVAGVATGAGEALARTTEGPKVRLAKPARGHPDGYPMLEITPSDRGLVLDGYRSDNAGDLVQQGWALLRRQFRNGPHERLGLLDELRIESCGDADLDILIDGEPATLGRSATITVAPCAVDLLATDHGF